MSDKQELIQTELIEVKIQMVDNVNQVANNIVKLDDLNHKSEQIQNLSKKMKRPCNNKWDKECVQIWVCSALFIILIIIVFLFLFASK